MITCSNCGEPVAAGMQTCRRCGLPLSGGVGSAADTQQGVPQQRELPAWLESLRAGERRAPNASGGQQSSFSAADLIDEESLPGWMRGEPQGDTAEHRFPAGGPLALHPAAEKYAPPPSQEITARSLIDEQSLPSWMRQGQAAGQSEQSGQSGQSRRSEGQEVAGADPLAKGSAQGLAAADLIEPAMLPEWMRSLEPSASRGAASPPGPAAAPLTPSDTPGQPLNARDLIDPQQLPTWLRGQDQAQAREGAPDLAVGGATRLNAASLLDMNALPAWLREAQQESAPAAEPARPQTGAPAAYTRQPESMGAPAGSLTGASLIDMDALPEWLRSGVTTPSAGEAPGRLPEPPRMAPEGLAQRMESMRVPSRPRNETGVNEQNEAAASVFASLLGVASVAPSLPYTPGADPRYGPVPSYQTQQMPPASPPAQGYPQGYSQGYPQGGYPQGYPQGQAASSPGANQAVVSSPYAGPVSPMPPGTGEQPPRQGGRPPKRSFLDVIRSWFPH